MHAFLAAKRTFQVLFALLLLLAAPLAVADEEASQGYLGVMLQDLSPSIAKALQLESDTGIMVSEVVDDGPAEQAGLEDGDVILEFDGKQITKYKDLTKAIRAHEPGDEVEVVVLREGRERTFDVTLGEREDTAWAFFGDDGDFEGFKGLKGLKDLKDLKDLKELQWLNQHGRNFHMFSDDDDANIFIKSFDSDRGFMGVHLDDLGEQLGDYFGVDDGDGALITEVVEDSPAEQAGLEAGDVIVKIDDEDIESSGDVHAFMSDTEPDQDIDVTVIRKGRTEHISLTCGEMPETEISKHIEVYSDDDDHVFFSDDDDVIVHRSPHALRRVLRHADGSDLDEGDLKELKEELKSLKEELKELREEIDK